MLESIGDLEKKMDGLTDLEKRMNKKVRHNNE